MGAVLFLTRWLLIFLLSLVVMLPPVWAIGNWGRERAEDEHRAARPQAQKGQKDLSVGLRGLEGLVAYTAGSFVVVWPLSLWASYRLLRNIGRARREPETRKPAIAEIAPSELVVAREQVLGAARAPVESADPGIVMPVAGVSLDDEGLAAQVPK